MRSSEGERVAGSWLPRSRCVPSILFGQANGAAKNGHWGDPPQPDGNHNLWSLETSPGPTTLELALRALAPTNGGKRAADAAQSPLEPLWKSPLWKYLPRGPRRHLELARRAFAG